MERHLERGEEEMRLSRAMHARQAATFERMMEAFDRHEAAFERMMTSFDRFEAKLDQIFEENRLFLREMNRRNERVVQELVKQNAEFNAEQAKRTGVIVAEMKDAREESRAHREAILALIDRLPPAAAA